MLRKLLLLSVAILAAYSPTHSARASNPTQRFEGIWLKKSIVDEIHAQSTPECGTLTATTPAAFAVLADGTLSLISSSPIPLALGKTDASGNMSSGIFVKLQVDGNTLLAQSVWGTSPVEYIRSTEPEVTQALIQTDVCLAKAEQPQTVRDFENRAILAKNKIFLQRAQSSGLDPALVFATNILTGSASIFAYGHYRHKKATGKINALKTESQFFTSQLRKETHELYKPIGQEFQQFKAELSTRLLSNSHWAENEALSEFFNPGVDLATFDGSYVRNGIGQGKVKLTTEDKARLNSMRAERANLIEEAKAKAATFTKGDALPKLEKKAKRAGRLRAFGKGLTIAALAFEGWALWYALHTSAEADELNAMIAMPDPELREYLRKHPNSGDILIETANKLNL